MMSEHDFDAETVAARVRKFLETADDGDAVLLKNSTNRTDSIRAEKADEYEVEAVSEHRVVVRNTRFGTVHVSITPDTELFGDELPELDGDSDE